MSSRALKALSDALTHVTTVAVEHVGGVAVALVSLLTLSPTPSFARTAHFEKLSPARASLAYSTPLAR